MVVTGQEAEQHIITELRRAGIVKCVPPITFQKDYVQAASSWYILAILIELGLISQLELPQGFTGRGQS